MKKPLPTFYEPEEVAESFGVTRRTVYNWLLSGKLPADKAGHGWRITEEHLKQFSEASKRASKRQPEPASAPEQLEIPKEAYQNYPESEPVVATNSERRAQARNKKRR